ncbi:endonuclease domain-containing protein [Microbacterium sp. M28]|uniref:endonuclease domain-containing protein n=1 Tax=Microbacterium sp. M28 TaxID=2962064 RepID=UPI0021F4313A|nr:endonuclease domain-containing protein [Microbacterium sp. M28]UYO98034.1 endonuclease domain-containing protein [Microbacterium sp. M28]
MAAQVDAGAIRRVRAGVFAANNADEAVVRAAAHGGALTCEAALKRHGVWTLTEEPRPHVWMGTNGRRHPHAGCTCVSHFFDGPTRFGLATAETALAHVHSCAGDEAFFTAFESAWRKGLLSRAARARIRDTLPESARWLVDLARADADSGLESLLRLRLHLLGIRLDCQVPIAGVGKVDFVIGGRLILEVDGRKNHDGGSMRRKDLVRDASASRLSYETLRFDYAQIIHRWSTVQAAILAALGRMRALS